MTGSCIDIATSKWRTLLSEQRQLNHSTSCCVGGEDLLDIRIEAPMFATCISGYL
jgi:hypothetical protein